MADFDFMKGLEYLKSNLQDLSAQRSILGANEEVQRIKSTELDEAQKVEKLRGVAQNLTMNLAGQGVPVERIDQLSRSVSPNTLYQSPEQAIMSGNPYYAGIGKDLMAQEQKNKEKLVQMHVDAQLAGLGLKNQGKQNDAVLKQMDIFGKTAEAKPILEGNAMLSNLKSYIAQGDNTAFNLAKRTLIVSSGDKRVSNEDVKAINADPSAIAEMKRTWDKYVEGQVLPTDFKSLSDLVNIMEAKNKVKLQSVIKNFAAARAAKLGVPASALEQSLSIQHLGIDPMAAPAPAAGADKVTVMKDGKSFSLPKAQLEEALQLGYKVQ